MRTEQVKCPITLAVVLGSLLLSSCTAHVPLVKRQVGSVSSYPHVQEMGGLAIAIDPITNANEVVDLFGMNLLEKELLPVLVVASNGNPSVSFVISPERFSLLNGKYESNRKSEAAGTGGAEAVGWTTAFIGIGPTLLAAPFVTHELDKALVINQNLRHQQLLQRTLSPGMGTAGYVYFTIPKEKRREPSWTLIGKALLTDAGGSVQAVTQSYADLGGDPTVRRIVFRANPQVRIGQPVTSPAPLAPAVPFVCLRVAVFVLRRACWP